MTKTEKDKLLNKIDSLNIQYVKNGNSNFYQNELSIPIIWNMF